MSLSEIIRQALQNIRSNLLRSGLTLLIIALGITALVGILTSIDGIIYSMSSNFSHLGANTFSINRKNEGMRRHNRGQTVKDANPISYAQALEIKRRLEGLADVSVGYNARNNTVVKYLNKKTNPLIRLRGIDDQYFNTTGYAVEFGRSFSSSELEYGTNKAVIGRERKATQMQG